MLPKLSDVSPIQAQYLDFLEQLNASNFTGDINHDYANRIALSTDNSIYQILPQGVVYPKTTDDIITLVKLTQTDPFSEIVLTPRGSGTSHNGQSLTDGLVVDLSKHMNKVLEINAKEGWARVQAGVSRGQLNKEAKEHGLFFASGLSSNNRKTIGGMISTNTSGQGAKTYGATRDHVLALDTVLLDGHLLHSHPINDQELSEKKQEHNASGNIYTLIDSLVTHNQKEIGLVFSQPHHALSGYDLAHVRTADKMFDLNAILCGSEGTLGFITEAKIHLLPIPTHTLLVNITYDSFDAALRHANTLSATAPIAIETMDAHTLALVQNNSIWQTVAELFTQQANDSSDDSPNNAINIIEYKGNNLKELKASLKALTDTLNNAASKKQGVLSHSVASDHDSINRVWNMRKKAITLLNQDNNGAYPISFIEDTTVPVEKLADYIAELRTLLDAYKLQYGLFGHADMGVIYVRPAIDLKIAKNKRLIRRISDAVVTLTKKYNGLLWGPHGKGFRSEYATDLFGELYPAMQQIKAAFDPKNQLNPGKIATAFETKIELYRVDKAPLRGQFDRQVSLVNREQFKELMYYHNSGDYNANPNNAVAPLISLTPNVIHTPKGRAALTREWLRGISNLEVDTVASSAKVKKSTAVLRFFPKAWNSFKKRRGDYDFSNDVHNAMTNCLAFESCLEQNRDDINATDSKAKFFELYYSRYLRPLRHRILVRIENKLPTLFRFKGLYNGALKMKLVENFLARRLGLVNLPLLSTLNMDEELSLRGVRFATSRILKKATPYDRHKLVIIVQDAYTTHFDAQLVLDTMEFLSRLGFNAYLAPYTQNGKQQHEYGFLSAFNKIANQHVDFLTRLSEFNIPLVGLEPSVTSMYRSEYKKMLGDDKEIPKVHHLQEWLVGQKEHLAKQPFALEDNTYHLLASDTETAYAPNAIKDWEETFSLFGLSLTIEHVGCSGATSAYGHETAKLDQSKAIYDLSWRNKVNDETLKNHLVATHYASRAQAKSFDQADILHPLQALLKHLKEAAEV